jgi:hypothetical protein
MVMGFACKKLQRVQLFSICGDDAKRERIPDCIFQYPYSHQLLLCVFLVVITNLFISYGSHHRKEKSSSKGPVCMMTDKQLKQNSLSCKLQSDS